jgi:hypothetical protein
MTPETLASFRESWAVFVAFRRVCLPGYDHAPGELFARVPPRLIAAQLARAARTREVIASIPGTEAIGPGHPGATLAAAERRKITLV